MADILDIGAIGDVNSPGSSGSTLNTGVLRRKYDFSDRVSELALSQDPFFRFLSMASKKPTDDPSFKFTERRGSWHKRYAYLKTYSSAGIAAPASAATVTSTPAADDVYSFKFGTDYASEGNIQNAFGQNSTQEVGDSTTQPQFFLPDQLINMADGTSKKISDVEVGDMVKGWDEATDTVKNSAVNEIQVKSHDDIYELHLENDKVLKPTGNHPFLTKDKGWTTIDGHDPNHAGGSGY